MRTYNIAFFTADWNYELVETTLHGLKRYAADHDNVYIRVFDCFGKDQGTSKDLSEYAIFNLPDLTQFDGLLIQGSQIVLESVRQTIAKRVAATGIPAVSIDCPIDGCTLITVDNREAVREITNHVIRDHGARRLAHLTGILENGCPEGHMRKNGFLDACRDNGIPPEDAQVIECTWRTSDGMQVGQRWLREGRPLPDAFVCANDEMAFGLMEALAEGGCHIPQDVMVTGFDNLSSSELSNPRLSTIDRDMDKLNYRAVDVLIDKIEGREHRDYIPFPFSVIKSESCGCSAAMRPGYLRQKYFRQNRFLKNFYVLQDQMAEELFDVSSLQELRDIVEQNHKIFGCDNVYLCVNDYYFDNYDKTQWQHDSETFGDEMVLTVCGQGGDIDPENPFPRFPTRELLPPKIRAGARFLVFYPLHYNTYSIGYLVMDGISEAAKLNLHKSIFSFLEIAIENVRKKGLLHHLNGVLDNRADRPVQPLRLRPLRPADLPGPDPPAGRGPHTVHRHGRHEGHQRPLRPRVRRRRHLRHRRHPQGHRRARGLPDALRRRRVPVDRRQPGQRPGRGDPQRRGGLQPKKRQSLRAQPLDRRHTVHGSGRAHARQAGPGRRLRDVQEQERA